MAERDLMFESQFTQTSGDREVRMKQQETYNRQLQLQDPRGGIPEPNKQHF